MDQVQKALNFAHFYHANAIRKEIPLPYLIHPLEVLKQIASWGIGKEFEGMWVAALLHDTVEDTEATIDQIKLEFGAEVAEIVNELTYNKEFHGSKEGYMLHLAKGLLKPLVLKMADRVCNVRDFMITNYPYAKKYFLKAEPIWETIFTKREDIQFMFGEETCGKICGTVESLRMKF